MNAANKYLVGLTGGIGSGKSAAADIFRSLGVDVVNADDLSREVVQPGQPALDSIAAHFGADILKADGSLDRASLRTLVFANSEHKSWLEALLHPLIAELMRVRLGESESDYGILESSQIERTERASRADDIVSNEGSLEMLRDSIEALHRKYQGIATQQ